MDFAQPNSAFQPAGNAAASLKQGFKQKFNFRSISPKKIVLVVLLVIGVFVVWFIKDNFIDRGALITVSGEGSVTASPSLVTLKVTFSNTASSSAQVLNGNQSLASVISQTLISQGVKKEDIKIFNASLTPIQGNNGNYTYRATNDIEVKFSDVSKYGSIINSLFQQGFVNISDVSFSAENASDLESEALDKAVKQALDKANQIAKSSHKRLGRMISINANSTGTAERSIGEASDKSVAAPIKIEILRQVSIIYELK